MRPYHFTIFVAEMSVKTINFDNKYHFLDKCPTLWIYFSYNKTRIDRCIQLKFPAHPFKGAHMKKDMKKLLAGLGVASLIGAGSVAVPNAHAAGSG